MKVDNIFEQRRDLLKFTSVLPFYFMPSVALAQEEKTKSKPNLLLKKADNIRFPKESFEVNLRIKSREDGGSIETRDLKVWSKGNQNTIVQTLSPASERGQILLMKDSDLWLFVPSVSQPVRLTLSQRLTGVVANGDIARANFAGDYNAEYIGKETVNGQECYVLELTALFPYVTYQKVKYWIRRGKLEPHKAEFYSISDRLLKYCTYENYAELGGAIRPTRIIMRDALKQKTISLMDYFDMKKVDLEEKIFTKDYLKKLVT